MKRQYALIQQGLQISGDTFPLRQRLKDMGARWVPTSKTWILDHTPENVEALLALGFALKAEPSPTAAPMHNPIQILEQKNWSVSELAHRISSALEQNLPAQFWLVGETIQVQKSRGHVWLEIADQNDAAEVIQAGQPATNSITRRASLSAVIWAGVLERLNRKNDRQILATNSVHAAPRNAELPIELGLKVRLLVHVDFREEGGRVQLVVDDLDVSYTQGQMALGREQVIAELKKRGLFHLNKQKRLARFPLKIALITANSSRARNDFLHEIERSGFSFETKVFDARMQGEGTAADVVRALSLIGLEHAANPTQPPYAVVVITRGGGSRMDLRWFDDFEIAKSIAYAPVPVVTAIGHFEDESIADLVSCTAEKTPTAAAQYLAQTVAASWLELEQRMGQSVGKARERLVRQHSRVDNLLTVLKRAAFMRIHAARKLVESHEKLVKVVSKHISSSLAWGYAIVRSDQSRLLRAEDFLIVQPPRDLRIEFRTQDGRQKVTLHAKVEAIETETVHDDSGDNPLGSATAPQHGA